MFMPTHRRIIGQVRGSELEQLIGCFKRKLFSLSISHRMNFLPPLKKSPSHPLNIESVMTLSLSHTKNNNALIQSVCVHMIVFKTLSVTHNYCVPSATSYVPGVKKKVDCM